MEPVDLIASGTPLLDVRAETEFAKGSFPAATNLPILDDDERAQVGTTYRQQGSAAAVDFGHTLISGAVKEARMQQWLAFMAKNPSAHICCWRGGQRSAITQAWLAAAGCQVPRVMGGYKALRNAALDTLANAANEKKSWFVLAGKTGSAKTVLIHALSSSIDLEGLANHRGSAFGARSTPQPAQASFENDLAGIYLRHAHETLVLEDESRTIGRVAVPEAWHARMQATPIVLIESELNERVQHIEQEYITDAGKDHEQLHHDYRAAASRIQRRLGGKRFQTLTDLLDDAFADRRSHQDWISYLLTEYYDPMYEYQLANKTQRIQFQGDFAACQSFLAELS